MGGMGLADGGSRTGRAGREGRMGWAGRAGRAGGVQRATAVRAQAAKGFAGGLGVKVCGVAHPECAELAAGAGADFVGMILAPGFKRSVELARAREICDAARDGGAEPVGVFVDEGAESIAETAAELGLGTVQLHGDGARRALARLPMGLRAIYQMTVDGEGVIVTQSPTDLLEEAQAGAAPDPNAWTKPANWVVHGRRTVDWVLLDGARGGSGEQLPWDRLAVPRGCSRRGWALAGGLGPDNVAHAVAAARPDLVDVSSGVAGPDGVRKDPAKVEAFVRGARSALRPT